LKIWLEEVATKEQRRKYYFIIQNYHGYVTSPRHVGRHIGWLIYTYPPSWGGLSVLSGCIGIGSYFLPEPKALKDFIGWNKEQFNRNFNKVANNWRFTLVTKTPNLASKVLSIMAKLAKRRWQEKYGDELVLLVSLVGAGRKGICYKAAGWQFIGYTAGSTAHGSITVSKKWAHKHFQYGGSYKRDKKERKMIFVKPLVKNWREKLLS